MSAYDYCALALILCGIIGYIVKRNVLANGLSFQIIILGLTLLGCRGLMYGYSRASFQLTFFLLFISNIFFMLFIATVFRLVKDFYTKNED